MRTSPKNPWRFEINLAGVGLIALALAGCGQHDAVKRAETPRPSMTLVTGPLAIALAPHAGPGRLDEQIRACQGEVRSNRNVPANLERLGWLFVSKARESFDAGYYTLAEQCAVALDTLTAGGAESLLLRGHALHSQHRFGEAASLARQLVSARALASDYGLLGDILVDIGRVEEAGRAYQAMLDLKPDPQGYARAAHLRWLHGDLEGAVELMRMAAAGASPRDAESAAWMQAQLARYLWQSGAVLEAEDAIASALAFRTNYPPALALRGRLLLARAYAEEAIESLREAARLNPLPECHWALADALRAAHRESEAQVVEQEILTKGPRTDPRSCSLFLATQEQHLELAVRLARQELAERADVFSRDALAWALAASGRLAEAERHIQQALTLRTQDARLWLHAGVIAAKNGRPGEAREWLRQAEERQAQLLPSERAHLRSTQASIQGAVDRMSITTPPGTESFSAAAQAGPAVKN